MTNMTDVRVVLTESLHPAFQLVFWWSKKVVRDSHPSWPNWRCEFWKCWGDWSRLPDLGDCHLGTLLAGLCNALVSSTSFSLLGLTISRFFRLPELQFFKIISTPLRQHTCQCAAEVHPSKQAVPNGKHKVHVSNSIHEYGNTKTSGSFRSEVTSLNRLRKSLWDSCFFY